MLAVKSVRPSRLNTAPVTGAPWSDTPYPATAGQTELRAVENRAAAIAHAKEVIPTECRRAAEFQTVDPDSVPRNRTEMRAYWDRMRPRLAVTDATVRVVEHYLEQAASAG